MPIKGDYQKIYIRAPNWVGDVVAATAIFREVRRAYPESHILLGVRPHLEPILRGGPWFDEILPAEGPSRNPGNADVIGRLKAEAPDLSIILPHSFRSAWPSFRAGIPARLGYSGGGRSLLLTKRLRPLRQGFTRIHVPMVYHYASLVGLVGVIPRSIRPELFYEDAVGKEAEEFLRRRGIAPGDPFALISPGASFGSSKLWSTDSFAAVIDGLQEKFGWKSLVHCGPGEEEIGKAIEAKAQHKPASTYDELRDLHQLKAIVDRCALMVVNDSGPRHYGVAFDKPIVCVMGPTHPNCTHANVEKTRVVRVDVHCGPCHLKTCPLDHRCMTRISPDMVLAAAEEVLQRN